MSLLPARPLKRVALKYDDTTDYYVGQIKVPKSLYDKAEVCEEYERRRRAGFDGPEVVALGQKCQEVVDELFEFTRGRGKEIGTPRKGKYGTEYVISLTKTPKSASSKKKVASSETTKKAKATTKTGKPTVKCGTDKNGRRYYYVGGKRATRDAYVAAGGRCKAAKK